MRHQLQRRKLFFFFLQTSVMSTSPPRSACVCFFVYLSERVIKKKCSSSPSHPRFFLYMYNYVYVCIIVKMPATTTRVKVKKQNLRSGERCFKKEKNTKSCRQLYKRYKVKCQQKTHPHTKSFFQESQGQKWCVWKATDWCCLECVYHHVSLSQSQSNHVFCVFVCTQPESTSFFRDHCRPRKCPSFFFFGEEKNMHQWRECAKGRKHKTFIKLVYILVTHRQKQLWQT